MSIQRVSNSVPRLRSSGLLWTVERGGQWAWRITDPGGTSKCIWWTLWTVGGTGAGYTGEIRLLIVKIWGGRLGSVIVGVRKDIWDIWHYNSVSEGLNCELSFLNCQKQSKPAFYTRISPNTAELDAAVFLFKIWNMHGKSLYSSYKHHLMIV